MKFVKKEFTTEVAGRTLTLEVSSLAQQANAAVLGKYGDTVVLVSVVMSERDASTDYMPLKVDYEERFYAAGKIIGSRFIRREGRPSEDAILTGRLVDRVIRPLFASRLRREMQVVATVLSYDEENRPDFVALMAASTALAISSIPWAGPVAGVRVAKVGDRFLVNPTNTELQSTDFSFETFAAGSKGLINMIELGGREAKEKEILSALEIAQKEVDQLIDFQKGIAAEIGRSKAEVALATAEPALQDAAKKFLASRLEDAVYEKEKLEHRRKMHAIKEELVAHLTENFPDAMAEKGSAKAELLFEEAVDELVHRNILEKDKRPDGRGLAEVRSLDGEVSLFKRTHGSAVFMRGNTQALAITTLASPGAEQLVETMVTTGKRRFLLHYNFPPYSVGEVGTFRGPGRREIGHGALAEKALIYLIPSKDEFPYTIRVVSEILSSNGSSSMATVSAAAMSLMDAGVPVPKAAAGIAMGLMSDEGGRYKILTDIQGPEDHYGDMDFKIAGTKDGVTALQLDVKVKGITREIIEKTLSQARDARIEILKFIESVIQKPREKISPYAPKIIVVKINPEKIGLVIGPGGKNINGLIQRTGVTSIDIEEDGRVFVSSPDLEKAETAANEIRALTKEYKVGDIIEGSVIKILDFGAIVDLGGGQDGMIHVSELKNGFVKNVTDVVKAGDFVRAKIVRVDADGHIGLSLKQLEK